MTQTQEGHPTIAPGAILVAKTTVLPEPLRLDGDLTDSGWAPFAGHLTGYQVENKLAAVGWTLFFKSATVTATGFGFERHKMIHAALKRLIATVTLQNCNCLEIDTVATHSFMGLPWVSISAHPRNIQKGLVCSG